LTSKYCCIIGVSFSAMEGFYWTTKSRRARRKFKRRGTNNSLGLTGLRVLRAFVINLFHTDLGGTGKQPMIVLHGMLGSSRNWQTTGRDLAQHYHVFALDARNHGKSPHAPIMNYAALADDIIAWMDARGIARAVLVGHSMGGKTAMLLACRHPNRVERLVVVDIAPKDYYWAAHRAEFAAMNELELTGLQSRQEAETRFEARITSHGMRKFLTTNLERNVGGGWRWAVNLPVLTEALPAMEKNSLEPEDHFAGPALFIAGGRSQYVQAVDHAVIRRHFPAAHIAVIADSGHNPHMDRREEFVRLVTGKL
jgi:pimeloyl-ACP methyl ester carboxylesterase